MTIDHKLCSSGTPDGKILFFVQSLKFSCLVIKSTSNLMDRPTVKFNKIYWTVALILVRSILERNLMVVLVARKYCRPIKRLVKQTTQVNFNHSPDHISILYTILTENC